jgi:ribosomal protein S18 acetylase RimI-like enzyme
MIVRAANEADCAAILELWRRAYGPQSPTYTEDDLRRMLAESGATLLVAEIDGRVVGTVIGGWDGWRGNIYRLAVDPEARRRSIGRTLVAAAGRILAAKGARRLSALVERDHAWATGFWDSAAALGYRRDPRMVRYVADIPPEPGPPSGNRTSPERPGVAL